MGRNIAEGLSDISNGFKGLNQTLAIHQITGGQAWDPESAQIWNLQKTAEMHQKLQDLMAPVYSSEAVKNTAEANYYDERKRGGGKGSGGHSIILPGLTPAPVPSSGNSSDTENF